MGGKKKIGRCFGVTSDHANLCPSAECVSDCRLQQLLKHEEIPLERLMIYFY